jgi:hypothetical protein
MHIDMHIDMHSIRIFILAIYIDKHHMHIDDQV